MANEILEELKKEANQSIGHIIIKVFNTLLEPILNGIDKIKVNINKCREARKIRNTMDYIIHYNSLLNYLEKYNFESVMHTTNNGNHSETGISYRYIHPIFSNVKSNNKMLELFCKNDSPISLYVLWMFYCIQNTTHIKKEFDDRMQSYFNDYEIVYWRKYRSVFYCILATDIALTQDHEKKINFLIDNLISK